MGSPPPGFQDWAIINVYFHGYENITVDTGFGGDEIIAFSPSFYCLGHVCQVGLIKYGDDVSVFLLLQSMPYMTM
jgi:hypothetical protein